MQLHAQQCSVKKHVLYWETTDPWPAAINNAQAVQ